MKTHTVTLIPGDGVGPDIADAVVQILAAAKAPVQWERQIVSTESVEPGGQLISEEALASIRKNTRSHSRDLLPRRSAPATFRSISLCAKHVSSTRTSGHAEASRD